MIMNGIQISHLVKIYQGEASSEKALTDINLVFNKGEKVLLVGELGSGKSTLLKAMGGAEEPTYGTIASSEEAFYVAS
ncbi:MAG: ATP-binding cassette domain-containing protein, partial [Candidatus Enteromonas sp.]|nr:ATP-binding cassette domain-containing protein [Candidatus Enteromonas sp.]